MSLLDRLPPEVAAYIPPPGMRLPAVRYNLAALGALGWLAWRREWFAFALAGWLVVETAWAGMAAVRWVAECQQFMERHR